MIQPFEWMLAGRYLRPRREEGFISVIAGFSLLGILLGVATLIVVMSVMNGFRQELLGRILGLNGHMMVQSDRGGLSEYNSLAGRIRLIDGVVHVTPVIEGQVMTSANGQASGAIVRGLSPAELRAHPVVSKHIVAGGLDAFQGHDSIVMGDKLAQKMGLRLGDKVTLISSQATYTPFGSAPRLKAYTVVALFQVGMYEYDSGFIFMPLDEAQIYFRLENQVSGLEITLADPDLIRDVYPSVQKAAGDGTQIVDWQQLNSSFFTALNVERNVMFLILMLIILVAAFNIISSLIMLVKDKSRDIAILRTMGAGRGSVMRVFIIAGASVGFAGTLLGLVTGLLFCRYIDQIQHFVERVTGTEVFNAEIYFLSQLPAIVDPAEVVLVTGMAFALSLLATLYPAWRAARLDPVEVLRYE